MNTPHHLVTASRVVGARVFGADGRQLGKIVELLIDKVSGKAAYALLRYDGFLGVGERYYPLPWSLLDYDPQKEGFATTLTRDQVDAGHHVDDQEVENEIAWRESVHAYYAAAPYWPF